MAGNNTWLWVALVGGGAYYFRSEIEALLLPAAAVTPTTDPSAPPAGSGSSTSDTSTLAALLQAQQQGFQQITQQNAASAADQNAAFLAALQKALAQPTTTTTPKTTTPPTTTTATTNPPALTYDQQVQQNEYLAEGLSATGAKLPDYVVTNFSAAPPNVNPVLKTSTGTAPVTQLAINTAGQFAVIPTAPAGQPQVGTNLYYGGLANNSPSLAPAVIYNADGTPRLSGLKRSNCSWGRR
jgi:hypothetical protein